MEVDIVYIDIVMHDRNQQCITNMCYWIPYVGRAYKDFPHLIPTTAWHILRTFGGTCTFLFGRESVLLFFLPCYLPLSTLCRFCHCQSNFTYFFLHFQFLYET